MVEQRKIHNTPDKAERIHIEPAMIAPRASDIPSDIGALIEPYRRELHLHCYRLLGSLHDAEDLVQETMLRAWQRFDTFKGTSSLRTWLYSIATHACLDALKKRPRRTLPIAAYPPAEPTESLPQPTFEVPWLEPFPTSWLDETAYNPEAYYTRRESISLAFLTALQLLPPRQRAILILSDVLDWRANEIAHLLEISASAVNSVLHRARLTLAKNYQRDEQEVVQPHRTDTTTSALLQRYVRAWENDDVHGLVTLLKEEATLSMPPFAAWYKGRDTIGAILNQAAFDVKKPNLWCLLPAGANGQPAYALYRKAEEGEGYRAFGIQLVTLSQATSGFQVAGITIFMTPSLVPFFDLPLHIT